MEATTTVSTRNRPQCSDPIFKLGANLQIVLSSSCNLSRLVCSVEALVVPLLTHPTVRQPLTRSSRLESESFKWLILRASNALSLHYSYNPLKGQRIPMEPTPGIEPGPPEYETGTRPSCCAGMKDRSSLTYGQRPLRCIRAGDGSRTHACWLEASSATVTLHLHVPVLRGLWQPEDTTPQLSSSRRAGDGNRTRQSQTGNLASHLAAPAESSRANSTTAFVGGRAYVSHRSRVRTAPERRLHRELHACRYFTDEVFTLYHGGLSVEVTGIEPALS